MAVKRSTDLLDVLDRVLDRGIVIEAWAGVSVAGIRLVDLEARILVTSCPTYLTLADAVAEAALMTRPVPVAPLTLEPDAPMTLPARPERQRGKRQPARERRAVPRRSTPPVRGSRTWTCDHGCTFQRAARWQRAAIPCPYDKGARCPVRIV